MYVLVEMLTRAHQSFFFIFILTKLVYMNVYESIFFFIVTLVEWLKKYTFNYIEICNAKVILIKSYKSKINHTEARPGNFKCYYLRRKDTYYLYIYIYIFIIE